MTFSRLVLLKVLVLIAVICGALNAHADCVDSYEKYVEFRTHQPAGATLHEWVSSGLGNGYNFNGVPGGTVGALGGFVIWFLTTHARNTPSLENSILPALAILKEATQPMMSPTGDIHLRKLHHDLETVEQMPIPYGEFVASIRELNDTNQFCRKPKKPDELFRLTSKVVNSLREKSVLAATPPLSGAFY